jgi:hypothetical protein
VLGLSFVVFEAFKYLLLACCLWCIYRGGKPERLGATLLIVDFGVRSLMKVFGHVIDFARPDSAYLTLTTILFGVSLLIALKSNRLWPLFFSAFFLVQLTGHLAVVVLESGVNWAYWAMTQVPIIVQTVILAIGTRAYLARARAGLRARDWL